jgi:hypothetical protein
MGPLIDLIANGRSELSHSHPWKRVEIDIAPGENDAHAFSADVDL